MLPSLSFDPGRHYLGPESWPQFFLGLLPLSDLFNYAAYLHDRFFSEGGNFDDFERANRIFRTMTLAIAETPLQRFFALFYAGMVDRYGKYFFKWRGSV